MTRSRLGHALAVATALGLFVHDALAQDGSAQSSRSAAKAINEQVQSLRTAHPEAQVQLDSRGLRVRRIVGLTGPRKFAGSPEETAREILKSTGAASVLGLSPDLRELCNPTTRPDPQLPRLAVVRMQQCFGPIKALGAELVMSVRMDPTSPAIELLTSNLATNVRGPLKPTITAADAHRVAEGAVKSLSLRKLGASPDDPPRVRAPELVVFDPFLHGLSGPTRLCWLVSISQVATLIDSSSGAVVYQYSEVVRTGGLGH